MNWLWINLDIAFGFLIIWFWLGPRLTGGDGLRKLLGRLILFIITLDCVSTLLGQPSEYWHNYSEFNECSILGQKLLALHPLAFTLGLIFWIILATFFIGKLSRILSYALFFAITMGHSLGAWTWLQEWLKIGLDKLIGNPLHSFWAYFYWEFSQYLFYILLAFIFAIILRKARRSK